MKLKPPLPEEDYPVDVQNANNDAVFTMVQHTHARIGDNVDFTTLTWISHRVWPLISSVSLVVSQNPQQPVCLIPRAQLDLKDGNSSQWRQQEVIDHHQLVSSPDFSLINSFIHSLIILASTFAPKADGKWSFWGGNDCTGQELETQCGRRCESNNNNKANKKLS